MAKIALSLDMEKDLKNIYDMANRQIYGSNPSISPEILKIIKNKEFEECKKELRAYNQGIYVSPLIPIFIKSVKEAWNKIEVEYYKKLESITKKRFPYKKVSAFVTTINTCPYSPEEISFMLSSNYSLLNSLKSIGHELMHLHFHHYYFKDIEKRIGHNKTHDLKEALTVLLNHEFLDLWFVKDKGYDKHRELREFIEKEWKKEKNFLVNNSENLENKLKREIAKYDYLFSKNREYNSNPDHERFIVAKELLSSINAKDVLDVGVGRGHFLVF